MTSQGFDSRRGALRSVLVPAAFPAFLPPVLALLLLAAGCVRQAGPRPAALPASGPGAGVTAGARSSPVLTIEGLETPESVLYDPASDRYLISNIHGSPFGDDGKGGFVSRVQPDGAFDALAWIDGRLSAVELDAPKGMAIVGDTLFVADVKVVRTFDRESGKPGAKFVFRGATFLNDVAASPDGTVYVSDSGFDPGFEASGSDAIHTIGRDGSVKVLVKSRDLGQPNGLLVTDEGLLVASWQKGTLSLIEPDGKITEVARLPTAELDGLARGEDGAFLVSSWAGGAIYRLAPAGKTTVVLEGLEAPADLGFDTKRGRLLIPFFNGKRVEAHVLPPR